MATETTKPPTRITATEAARNFSDLLNRVRYRGESFTIERSGEVVAQIIAPPQTRKSTGADLSRLLAEFPLPDDEFANDIRQIIKEQPIADLSDPWER